MIQFQVVNNNNELKDSDSSDPVFTTGVDLMQSLDFMKEKHQQVFEHRFYLSKVL